MRIVWIVDSSNKVVLDVLFSRKVALNGREVAKVSSWKRFAEVEVPLEDGRAGLLVCNSFGALAEYRFYVDKILQLSEKDKVMQATCLKCRRKGTVGETACASCGQAYADAEQVVRRTHVKGATHSIAILAAMFFISGVVFFFIQQHQAAELLKQLEGHADSEQLTSAVAGSIHTVGELRAALTGSAGPWAIFVVNAILGFIMLALSYWSRTAPLAAILVAAAIFAVVNVVNAFVNPMTVSQGLIVKIMMTGLLVRGVRACLELRAREKTA